MDGHSVFISHFVELVDADHPGVGQDHCTAFKIELPLKKRGGIGEITGLISQAILDPKHGIMGKGETELKLTDTGSRCTAAVRPAALEPLPEVYTAIGATCSDVF